MSSLAPAAVLTPHHFEVSENDRGYWIAKDQEGLVGGYFALRRMPFASRCLRQRATASVSRWFLLLGTIRQYEWENRKVGRSYGRPDPLSATPSNLW